MEFRPIQSRTLRAQILETLRDAILSGELAPGSQLREATLARSLGVSRGPLREALRELEDEGLVVTVPYTGTFVSEITTAQIREIYSFRTVLERFAYELVWPRRDADFFAELERRHAALTAAIDRGDGTAAIETELRLHSLPYEWAGHSILYKTWQDLQGRLHFYFAIHQKAHGRPGPARDAHDAYVRLAKGNDLGAMHRHIDTHMQQGLDTVLEFVTAFEQADSPKVC